MRQRIAKMLLSVMLAVVCVLNMGITVYADAEYDSGMTKEEVIAKYTVDTGNEQADEVFNQYLEVASDILVGDKYATYISTVEIGDPIYRTCYCLYAGGTEAEWDSKTTFEKMLWQELYVNPLAMIAENSYESVLGTLDSFLYVVGESTQSVYSRYDAALAEAYLKIMEWQYNYIIENNAVYNFMTGEDSNGNKPGSGGMSPVLIIVVVIVVALAGGVVLGKKKGNSGKKAA